MTRVAVVGAGGRMGAEVCRSVAEADDLSLVAAVDPLRGGAPLSTIAVREDLTFATGIDAVFEASAEVVVDFTTAAVARTTLIALASHGIHAVVGTTGLGEKDLETLSEAFTSSNCLIAPNFAIGAILMMRFAEVAAEYFETAEVIEYHHDAKIDAPSGTALLTAQRLAQARSDWAPDPTTDTKIEGCRGGTVGGVGVHSVRMRGMVAHQEVILGTTGQTLTIRHDSYDRTSFMPGVLLAVRRIGSLAGVTVGLDALLDI